MVQQGETPIFGMPLRGLLLVSGIYTLVWGAFFKWLGVYLMPWLAMGGLSSEVSTNAFGTFGMIVGLLLFLSAFYPSSWFYLMAAGVVGKAVSACWFIISYAEVLGWNKRSIFHLVFNELLWLIPLCLILSKALKVRKYLENQKN